MAIHWLKRCLPIESVKGTIRLQPHEDPFIDGLRGVSVVMVILYHALFAVHLAFKGQPEKFQIFLNQFPSWTQFIFGFDKAVDIFFMISAYLLGTSLLKQTQKGPIGIRTFYSHRVGRIYPLFLVALLLYGLPTGSYFFDVVWHNLLFIDNYTFTTLIPVGWSLSVEMQCYLLLPFLMAALARSQHPVFWLLTLIAASVVLRWLITRSFPAVYETPFVAYLANERDPAEYMRRLYEATPARFGSFVVGLLWAYLEPLKHRWNPSPVMAHIGWILLTALVVATLFFPVYLADSRYYDNFDPHINQAIIVSHRTLFSLALLGLILLVRVRPDTGLMKGFRQLMSLPLWRPFSRLAFPAYLFHFPFIAIAWLLVVRTTQIDQLPIPSLSMAFLAAGLTALMVLWFSLPFHYLIERPGILWGKKLGDRWMPKRPAAQ